MCLSVYLYAIRHTHRQRDKRHASTGRADPNHYWLWLAGVGRQSITGSVGPAGTCPVTSHSLHGQLFPCWCSENHGIPSFGSPRAACTPWTRRNVNPPSVSARAARASGERDAMSSRRLCEIAGAKAARFGELKTDIRNISAGG